METKLLDYAKLIMKSDSINHASLNYFCLANPREQHQAAFMIAQMAIDLALEETKDIKKSYS